MTKVPTAVQRFLEGIQTANWDGIEDYYTPDVLYDASVPGWHYQYEGVDRMVQELREEWTGKNPWRIIELHTMPTPDGVVVDIEIRGQRQSDAHSAPREVGCRIANIFQLEGDRIAEHRYYCCGEWDEETLRRVEAVAPKVRRAAAVSMGRVL